MKSIMYLAATLAVLPAALAVDVKKSVIVWFEKDNTPSSVVNEAKKKITDAGGKITHVYDLIMGFSAIAPEQALEQVKLYTQYDVRVEVDQVVTIS